MTTHPPVPPRVLLATDGSAAARLATLSVLRSGRLRVLRHTADRRRHGSMSKA